MNDSSTAADRPPPVLVIGAPTPWWRLNLAEIWQFRDMLFFLVWRNILIRYKQTLLGFAWVIVQPLAVAFVFALVFSRAAGLPTDARPPMLFYFSGLVMWMYFSSAVSMASTSLSTDSNLIRKIYFPRLILPITGCVTTWVDFAVACLSLGCMMIAMRFHPGYPILAAPLFLCLATVTAFSVSLWLATLDIQFHDIRYTVPFLIQVWMFLSPVILSASEMCEKLRVTPWVYGLNPMATVITGFRWSSNLGAAPPVGMALASCAVALLLAVSGLWYFKRTETFFADVI